MILTDVYVFHFLITGTIREKLKNLNLSGLWNSLSGIIVGIMSLIDPLIPFFHEKNKIDDR